MKTKNYFKFLFLLQCNLIMAQAPANDNCNTATVLPSTCLSNQSATTVGATPSGKPSCTTTDADDDIWYKVTATSESLEFTISDALLENGDPASIGMAVQSGPCVDPFEFFCNNNFATGSGKVTVSGLNAGTTYTFRFWTTGTAQKGTFKFCCADPAVVPERISEYLIFCNKEEATFKWTTTFENNNQFFKVDKSLDGQSFKTIANVPAALNASNGHAYSFTDPELNIGPVFYRIAQVDLDGNTIYYKILEANCQPGKSRFKIYAYPNPVSNLLFLPNEHQLLIQKVKIFDVNCRILKEITYDQPGKKDLLKIDVSNLVKGLYILQVSVADGNIQTLKFLKD